MIVVTACYAIEARWIVNREGVRVVRTAVGESAPEALEGLLGDDVASLSALVSTGFCGALQADLRMGDLVLADVVRHRGEEILVSPQLLERAWKALDAGGYAPRTGACVSVVEVADGPRKRALADDGALSVDMESGPLARWAREQKVPFLSLRVVLDPLGMDLPFSAKGSLAGSVLRHPVWSVRVALSGMLVGRTLGRALNNLMSVLEEGA